MTCSDRLATVTANGVVIGIGGGKSLFGSNLILHLGMGLLDRAIGKLRGFVEGREDSLAMSTVAIDGRLYVVHPPAQARRAQGHLSRSHAGDFGRHCAL